MDMMTLYYTLNSMDWNDNAIEIWEYDPSKAKQYMDKEMGESAALLNLYLGLASSMGFDYKSEIRNQQKCDIQIHEIQKQSFS